MGVLLSIPACRALAVLMLQQSMLQAAEVSVSLLGYWQEGLQNIPTTRIRTTLEVGVSPAWGSRLVERLLPSTAMSSQYFRNSLPEPLSSHNVKLFCISIVLLNHVNLNN